MKERWEKMINSPGKSSNGLDANTIENNVFELCTSKANLYIIQNCIWLALSHEKILDYPLSPTECPSELHNAVYALFLDRFVHIYKDAVKYLRSLGEKHKNNSLQFITLPRICGSRTAIRSQAVILQESLFSIGIRLLLKPLHQTIRNY